MNCNEMAGDRLTVCEQAFARLVSISSNFWHIIRVWQLYLKSLIKRTGLYDFLCSVFMVITVIVSVCASVCASCVSLLNIYSNVLYVAFGLPGPKNVSFHM